MATLSDRDARAWQALAERISPTVQSRLGRGVLANRTLFEAGSRESLGPALSRARAYSAALSARSEVTIRTDVRAFYPSVTPGGAFHTLERAGVDREVAAVAAEMLDGWGSEGYAGLPIGPPGSAVIANAVLHGVDQTLRPLPCLRWVDDYLIGLQEERQIAEVLDRLDTALDSIGLERSVPKTTLLGSAAGFVWPGTYGGGRASE